MRKVFTSIRRSTTGCAECMDSLEIILERYEGPLLSDEDKQKMAEEKNEIYKKLLEQMTPADVSDEVKETLDELRKRGYLLSIGSSSKCEIHS